MPVVLKEPQSTNDRSKLPFNLSIEVVEDPFEGSGTKSDTLTLTARWDPDHFICQNPAGITPPGTYTANPNQPVTVTWTHTIGRLPSTTYRIPQLRGHCTLPASKLLIVLFEMPGAQPPANSYRHKCNEPVPIDEW